MILTVDMKNEPGTHLRDDAPRVMSMVRTSDFISKAEVYNARKIVLVDGHLRRVLKDFSAPLTPPDFEAMQIAAQKSRGIPAKQILIQSAPEPVETTTDAVMPSAASGKIDTRLDLLVGEVHRLQRREKDLLEANVRFEARARRAERRVVTALAGLETLIDTSGDSAPGTDELATNVRTVARSVRDETLATE